jgi:hypothetical protein
MATFAETLSTDLRSKLARIPGNPSCGDVRNGTSRNLAHSTLENISPRWDKQLCKHLVELLSKVEDFSKIQQCTNLKGIRVLVKHEATFRHYIETLLKESHAVSIETRLN